MSPRNDNKLSRRAFLKQVGAGAAAMVALQAGAARAEGTADNGAAAQSWGILIDLTRCTGCGSCALACKESNHLPQAEAKPQAFDSNTYTFVETRSVATTEGEAETRYVKRQCMHCLNAACVAACPAAAMHKSAEGPVIYRPERCLGCRYCQIACPFGVPAFEWQNGLTPVISKCWLCYSRLQEGQRPACVEACPTGALRFGRRDELLAQAHAQIATAPERYVDHVFGEFEVGGTSMLYLSDIPFEELGFPADLPQTAPPEETEKIMNTLPGVIIGLTALLAGTARLNRRKSKQPTQENEGPTTVQSPLPAERLEE
jgi:formate dehydrogenase iron-sulfur subunit